MQTHIVTKLRHNMIAVLALVCVVIFSLANSDATPVQREPVSASAPELARAHDCWSGDAPDDMAGRMPGHVVVTVAGEPRYAGPRMVAKALDQVFGDVDHGLAVHAFCR
jgi:hypothetical protein